MKSSNKILIEFTLNYNKYKTQLYNFSLNLLSDRMLAEDILQSVFVKFYLNLPKIKNKSSIKFWLFTSVRNEIYSYFRKCKNQKTDRVDDFSGISDSFYENNLESIIEKKELQKILNKKLETLPLEQKEVFYLKEYGAFSYKEIAEMLNINVDLVKSRLYKTRQKLITYLKEIYLQKEISEE